MSTEFTQKEFGRLTNGYYTVQTLEKLMKIDYLDCQRWDDNPIFRQFLTKTVGTTPGYWKAPKAIQSWAVQILVEHYEEEEKDRLKMVANEEKVAAAKKATEEKATTAKKAAQEKKALTPSGFAFHGDDLIAM